MHARSCAVVVGSVDRLQGALRSALGRDVFPPIREVADLTSAYGLVAALQPDFVVLDLAPGDATAEVGADMLRALAPRCWVLDLAGVVRRRPEHGRFSLRYTQPLPIGVR